MAMNRQRRTSNISNIFSYDDAGNIVIKDYSQVIRYSWNGTIHGFIGPVSVSSVAAATTDTDKFLVSDGGVLKFRTGAEVLSDIGGQPLLTNPVTGTGVAGQVAYWSGTNSQTGSNNLFWDAANNRLGIGLTNPLYGLDVSSSVRFSNGTAMSTGYSFGVQRLQFNNGVAGGNIGVIKGISDGIIVLSNAAENNFTRLVFGSTTSSFPALQRTGVSLCVVDAGSGTLSNLIVGSFTDGGQRLQVQGTALITGNTEISAGNLSIFTTNTPRRLNLQVANGSKAAAIGIEAGGTIHSVIGADTSGTDFLQVASRAGIAFYSGSTIGNIVTDPTNERMRLTTLGRLLLGTTTESTYLLDVNGTARLSGDLVFGSTNFNIVNNIGANIISHSGSGVTFSSGNASSFFRFLNFGAGQYAMYIFPSTNIGINTATDAGYKLDVNGTARVSGSLQVNSKIGINSLGLGSLLFDAFTSSAGTIATLQSNGAAADNILLNVITGNSVTGELTVFKGSSTTSGALDNILQQNGNGSARFQSLVLGTGDAYSLYNINGGQAWSVGLDNSDSDKFKISGSSQLGTSDYLTITTGGNLLVGTTVDTGYRVQITSSSADSHLNVWGATAPSIRLDNAASGASQRFLIGLATATNNFIQGANAGDVCLTTASASAMVFGMWQTSSSSEVMRISTSSNVLIGKNTDSGQKLQVVGKVNLTSLPTSATGLVAGDIWNNGGVLNIV